MGENLREYQEGSHPQNLQQSPTYSRVQAIHSGPFGEPPPLRSSVSFILSYDVIPPLVAPRHKVQILNYEPPHGCRASGNIVFCDRARLSKLQRRHMPDIVAINEHFQLVVDKSKASCEPLEIDSMALVEYFITVQPDREDDFFHDPRPEMKHLFDPNKPSLHTHFFALSHIHDPEEKAKATRGLEQMITRVQDMWDQQHRTHIFTISMAGSMARFLLWDRSGAIVTRAFDIRQQPDLLDDFQSMYYRSSREVRGYDTTVSWAGSVKSTSKDEPKGLGKGQRTEPEEGS